MIVTPRPLTLIILDGFGHSESSDYNAIYAAKKPVWDRLLATQPHGLISGSGMDVGLPDGQMGNSKVGHMNLGADHVIYQGFTRVTKAIRDGEFSENPVTAEAVDRAVAADKAVHILDLLSPGSVRSHEDHLVAMAQMIARRGVDEIHLHTFLDGCDTLPKSAQPSLERLNATFVGFDEGRIASIIGYYFTMDRDNRWDRVQAAYGLVVDDKAEFIADSSVAALRATYAHGENGKLVKATAVVPAGAEAMRVKDGDTVIFANFRVDCVRGLNRALAELAPNEFPRERALQLVGLVMPTQYAASIPAPYTFPPEPLTNVLGEYLAKRDETQLRIAEIERYVHMAFFSSGGREKPYEGEERILIPSPKVTTCDLQPGMDVPEVTDHIVEAIEQQRYDVIVVNYANGDIVSRAGVLETAAEAVECLDTCMGYIIETLDKVGGEALITADHGNVEQMEDESIGQAYTAHIRGSVPFAYIGKRKLSIREGGVLADMAPIMLVLMGLKQPAEMTGCSVAILS